MYNGRTYKKEIPKHIPASQHVKYMIEKGYMITSRHFRIAARIDRDNWIAYCKEKNYPVCADWYRRCVSEDKIEGLNERDRKLLPKSSDYRGRGGRFPKK